MKNGLVFGILLAAAACFSFGATAGLPCAAYSTCDISPVQVRPCANTDVIWDAFGRNGYLRIDVTVNDCLDNPIDTCRVRLDYGGTFGAESTLGTGTSGFLCGTGSMSEQTDALGVASFVVTGGGCGALVLNWTVTAECASPEVELCMHSDTLCVKSTDFNGDGTTQFLDTFKYLQALGGGGGYCQDLHGCTSSNFVTFQDTFVFLLALADKYECEGFSLGNTETITCNGPWQ